MIERTPHAATASIKNVCVNHCSSHVLVTQQFLNGPDIISILEKVGREAVTKRMTTSISSDLR